VDPRRSDIFVHRLCRYIQHHRPVDSHPSVLNLTFNDEMLVKHPADIHAHPGAPPTMSLGKLLRRGYFLPPTAGGAVGSADKAVLALSLARCLLHFFHGPWMNTSWSADDILFLCTEFDVNDIFYPYVRYPLLTPGVSTTTEQAERPEHARVVLSFGRLLLEIESGQLHPVDSSNLEEMRGSLCDALERLAEGKEIQPSFYYPIRGCLQFNVSIDLEKKRKPNEKLLYQIRNVINKDVIYHLEQYLSTIRGHDKLPSWQRSLSIADRSTKPMPTARHSCLPARPGDSTIYSRAAIQPHVPSAPSRNPSRGTPSICSSSIYLATDAVLPTIMFDGDFAAPNPQYVYPRFNPHRA